MSPIQFKEKFIANRLHPTDTVSNKWGTWQTFQGRPLISKDKPINEGVYLGAGAREAIVVDDQKDRPLSELYQTLLGRLKELESQGKDIKSYFLGEVFKLVQKTIPYDSQNTDNVASQVEPDGKIYLSHFFGGGVCRHQALLVGYLLEKLAKDGYAGGQVSIDRNYVPGKGGHAWARYKSSGGIVYILDVAQDYIGKLEDISENDDRWFYERPEDKSKFLKLMSKVKKKIS